MLRIDKNSHSPKYGAKAAGDVEEEVRMEHALPNSAFEPCNPFRVVSGPDANSKGLEEQG